MLKISFLNITFINKGFLFNIFSRNDIKDIKPIVTVHKVELIHNYNLRVLFHACYSTDRSYRIKQERGMWFVEWLFSKY